MRKIIALVLTASLSLVGIGFAQAANPKAGTKCAKVNQKVTYSGKTFTCVKKGKSLVWDAGVPVAKPAAGKTVSEGVLCTEGSASAKDAKGNTLYCTKGSDGKSAWRPQSQQDSGGGSGSGSGGGAPPTAPASPTPSASATVVWRFDGKEWISQGSVPQCPSPLIPTGELLDFSKVLSIVQPGQIRGGSYKPHAGLRWSEFGGVVKGISIKAPFDGEVVAAAQYISEGNYQFTINIIHPCGIMLRLGHLLEPSDSIKKILSTIPPAIENDSRESFLSGTFIKKDQLIASEVGMVPPASPDSLGTFMDLGIVDLRKKNPALDSNFKSNADIKYALYSVCWYEGDYFSDSDRARVLNLPFSNGDATSDYCKRR